MSGVVLLDGGMGQELIRRSSLPATPLWSAEVMMKEPHIVSAIHRDYAKAGASVLTLNTYSATPERLARDASEDLFEPLQAQAISIAAAVTAENPVTIAGCLSPLFGSYHPEKAPDEATCFATYQRIVAEQVDAVDVFMCETMASVKEVRAAVRAAAESGKPVWCGMTVLDEDGTKLRSGEPLADGVSAAKECGASAVLINCSWPEAVTQGLSVLAASGLPFGGYANGFTSISALDLGGTVDGLSARTDLDPAAYAAHAMDWVNKGATLIGGCCEVGPAHIAEIANQLRASGREIVSGV